MGGWVNKIMAAIVERGWAEEGQTMAEYALLTVFVAMVVIVAVQLLGTNLLALFTSFANAL